MFSYSVTTFLLVNSFSDMASLLKEQSRSRETLEQALEREREGINYPQKVCWEKLFL